MLTREENERLTLVGPGTPMGELLRRYWQPVAATRELSDERPKMRVKVLGEDLVLFRTPTGTHGLVGEQCSHRGASLYYGFLEGDCIRCPYHGWLYDAQGKCVEQPFEPQQSMLKHTIRHPAYAVQKLGGLLWTYMGPPERQPLLPRWDVLVRKDGTREIEIRPELHCNFLQAAENSADSTHVYFLHHYYDAWARGLRDGVDFNQQPMEGYGFQRFEYGIMKCLRMGGDYPQVIYERPMFVPNFQRVGDAMHWRVPIDDVSTRIFWVGFKPSKDGSIVEAEEPPLRWSPPWTNAEGEYLMDVAQSQDGMAWETQGKIADRTKEHLGYSDHGVALFREMLFEQMDIVEKGGDPMGLIWDPAQNEIIDLWATCMGYRGAFPPPVPRADGRGIGADPANPRALAQGGRSLPQQGVEFERAFDDTYVEFEVPPGAARPVRR